MALKSPKKMQFWKFFKRARSGPTHAKKLITVRPDFNFRIEDFYSGPIQKQGRKKKKLLVAQSVNVPL